MSTTLLTEEQKAQFITDAMNGATPKELSETYKIGVSSAHNYKKRLEKERGITFPNVQGRRASTAHHGDDSGASGSISPIIPSTDSAPSPHEFRSIDMKKFVLINVCGLEVFVSKGAKNISVHATSVIIDC